MSLMNMNSAVLQKLFFKDAKQEYSNSRDQLAQTVEHACTLEIFKSTECRLNNANACFLDALIAIYI